VGKSVLVFIDWFDPGYRAGGPIRSAVNFARHLQQDYDIYVFTGDRDLGSTEPYDNITCDTWIPYDQRVKVFYCSPAHLTKRTIRDVIHGISPDYIYLNSLFSKYFTIYPLLIVKRGGWKYKVVLASRGMLRTSALQYKAFKKKRYLQAFKLLAFHRHIVFQATDDTEFNDVQKNFGAAASVVKIPNLPAYVPPYMGSIPKSQGELTIIFVGRLHPIKNLDFLLNRLAVLQGKVSLTIIGSEEEKEFVARCLELSASLPVNITVTFGGEKPNHELPAIIGQHHTFCLPTKGENFGHAIFEALSAGKPVLISDQTPWRGLAAVKSGWDIALSDSLGFEKALQNAVDMGQEQYNEWSEGAWNLAWQFSTGFDASTKYAILFP
jgi:glycosyltransferase involved in cell wall biosynthesis